MCAIFDRMCREGLSEEVTSSYIGMKGRSGPGNLCQEFPSPKGQHLGKLGVGGPAPRDKLEAGVRTQGCRGSALWPRLFG